MRSIDWGPSWWGLSCHWKAGECSISVITGISIPKQLLFITSLSTPICVAWVTCQFHWRAYEDCKGSTRNWSTYNLPEASNTTELCVFEGEGTGEGTTRMPLGKESTTIGTGTGDAAPAALVSESCKTWWFISPQCSKKSNTLRREFTSPISIRLTSVNFRGRCGFSLYLLMIKSLYSL